MTRHEVLIQDIKTPANILPYVEALGVADAVRLFLAIGGSNIYLPRMKSSEESLAAKVIGAKKVLALAKRLDLDYAKVPVAREWIAKVMSAEGVSTAEISRTVRADVATVRRWLNSA